MLHTMQTLFGQAVMERAVLLANHVLSAEPVALDKLRPHVGRRIEMRFDGWPAWLPPLPPTVFRITPAALVEWCGHGDTPAGAAALAEAPARADPAADLQVVIDASNPLRAAAQALGGERPSIQVAGDAAFATDVNWLFDNLRWDLEDDLAQWVGPLPAREAARLGGLVAAALRQAVRAASGLAERGRGDGPGPQ